MKTVRITDQYPEIDEPEPILTGKVDGKVETIRLTLPNNPTKEDFYQALVRYEERKEMKSTPIKIPKLSYPSSGLKTETATQAFINQVIKGNLP